ncbi:hypothetical protein PVL29_015234 [Vitis rotundifolia]|uniref:Trans-resveratrol di-O-methyltransferase-like n=1 Tax=Vitis rotundifolia TaxID=103349 RepID=A0AA38ZCZ3_VITRO|nr:hypothetical protein PVL29_015234 [Vitis rotundifolia]
MECLRSRERATELLHSQVHTWKHTTNFVNSMALKCAIQLGIPDVIHSHGQPMALSQLVTALSLEPTKAPCLYRLMRVLVHSGFFAQQKLLHNSEEEEGYSLTFASHTILAASAGSHINRSWHFLGDWFQNEDPTPFHTAHRKSFWDYAVHEPKLNDIFNETMVSDSRLIANMIVRQYKEVFEGLTSLVDVGGGTGTMAKAIAKAFPQLKCIVFDQPHVVANLEVGENLEIVEGNIFEAIPPADAILLKWILHDWSDEECVKTLKKCKGATPNKRGKVIIIDMVVESNKGDNKAVETQLFIDMLMMVVDAGKERNEKEWEKLFLAAGFTHYKITPALGLRSLIEVYP